ncbi:unnamed protein product [Cuscuta europaea]|uniref:Late embryogenesis abundant protein LEA-2 subgroup domain-containing protein n=1 Tax=Cuscuta europaea TaxID=41803 RepID=A0A9P1E5R3_CUSEU|nr:unnamed protein product [Cuscuta europaea]
MEEVSERRLKCERRLDWCWKNTKWIVGCIVVFVGLLIVTGIFCVYRFMIHKHHDSDQKLPAYSVTDAGVTNVNINTDGSGRFTADFSFTLNASNPNTNHTLYYNNGSAVEVTLSFTGNDVPVPVVSAAFPTGILSQQLLILPRASADLPFSLHAQDVPPEFLIKPDMNVFFANLTVNAMAASFAENSTYLRHMVECRFTLRYANSPDRFQVDGTPCNSILLPAA